MLRGRAAEYSSRQWGQGAPASFLAPRLSWHVSFGQNRSVMTWAQPHLALLPGHFHTFNAGCYSRCGCCWLRLPWWTWKCLAVETILGKFLAPQCLVSGKCESSLNYNISKLGFSQLRKEVNTSYIGIQSSCKDSVRLFESALKLLRGFIYVIQGRDS